MTLSGNEVLVMKPKAEMVTIKQETDAFAKQGSAAAAAAKMAMGRAMGQKRGGGGGGGAFQDRLGRGTVLVNNLAANQRNVISNARNVNNNNNNNNNNVDKGSELMRCKRKIHFLPGQTYPSSQPASVARRNARERNRVKQVNNGFATLRSHIPPSVAAALTSDKSSSSSSSSSSSRNSSANKKLSKVETLKMAVEYIRSLQQMLEDHNNAEKKESVEESYYSSSPETVSCLPVESPPYVKSEGDVEYYKDEGYRPKMDAFDHDIHNALTSEFYQARSPAKAYYPSPERSPEKMYEASAAADGKAHDHFRHYDRSPESGLTVLNNVADGVHFAFAQPRMQHHRGSTSLSPATVSDACPSPTPSYSSDQSGIHPGSVGSGHLVTKLSRLSTGMLQPARSGSPMPSPSYPMDFHKDSPSDAYDSYEAVSPEDEELLDVISWWQQSH